MSRNQPTTINQHISINLFRVHPLGEQSRTSSAYAETGMTFQQLPYASKRFKGQKIY